MSAISNNIIIRLRGPHQVGRSRLRGRRQAADAPVLRQGPS